MQKFFTPSRRGTNSVKWDLSQRSNLIPLWVADMDFTAPQAVLAALNARIEHGVFGYTFAGEQFYQSFCGWMQRRHGCTVVPDELQFAPGVMPFLRAALSGLVPSGGTVVVPEPVYYPFFSAVTDANLNLKAVALQQELSGRYVFDYAALTDAMQGADALLLCSPQNPVGRVWSEQELRRVLKIAAEQKVLVLVDEIHQDILFPNARFVPVWQVVSNTPELTAVSTRLIAVTAPSKTFNIPGLSSALVWTRDAQLKKQISELLHARSLDLPNVLALEAATAAYNKGDNWLDTVLDTIYSNYQIVLEWSRRMGIGCVPQEGTYLVWLDFRSTGCVEQAAGSALAAWLRSRCGVWLSEGSDFTSLFSEGSRKAGSGFLRLNLAAPPERIREALQRITALLSECSEREA